MRNTVVFIVFSGNYYVLYVSFDYVLKVSVALSTLFELCLKLTGNTN